LINTDRGIISKPQTADYQSPERNKENNLGGDLGFF
jgi:hypothetical protein